VRFAGSRRPVQQDAPLEVLAMALQRLAVGGNAHGVVRHLLQESRREDHLLRLKPGPGVEGHPAAARSKLAHGQGNDLALQHALAVHPPPVLGQERRPGAGVFRHYLKGSRLPPGARIRRPLEHTQPPAVVLQEPQPEAHRLPLRLRSHCEVHVVRLGQRKLRESLRLLDHVAERLVVPLPAPADPHQPAFGVEGREVRHHDVRVHEPVGRYLFLHHRKVPGGHAQMVG
jgi:hypothetical protein